MSVGLEDDVECDWGAGVVVDVLGGTVDALHPLGSMLMSSIAMRDRISFCEPTNANWNGLSNE